MKTLVGHLSGPAAPNLGRANPQFLHRLAHGSPRSFRTLNTPAPFVPLRQPMGGHGNPRKEHPARPA